MLKFETNSWWRRGLIVGALAIIFWLRLWQLDQVPAGATVDEVNYGYIAYSLAQTGRDEHAVAYPLVFEAYGDQKLPGQAYLIWALVRHFGLSLLMVRLPSALASCLLVVMIYHLVRAWRFPSKVAYVTAGLWALAPAPFMLGRAAWESNLALLCLVIALWGLGSLVHRQKREPRWQTVFLPWLAWSLGLGLSWYFYIPYRLVSVVIWLVSLLLVWRGHCFWRQSRKLIVTGVIVSAISVLPLLLATNLGTNTARLGQVGSDQLAGIILEVNEKRTFCEHQGYLPRWWCDAIYNKITLGSQLLVKNAFNALGIDYLVFTGEEDLPTMNVAGFGQLPLVGYGLALVALIPLVQSLWFGQRRSGLACLLLAVLIIGVGPAALVGPVQKVRASAMLPAVFLLIAWGSDYLARVSISGVGHKRCLSRVIVTLAGVYTLAVAAGFWTTYFAYHYYKNDWQTLAHVPRIDSILGEASADEIYWHVTYPDALMFYAFDTRLDPAYYQQKVQYSPVETSGFSHAMSLDERYFVTDQSVKSLACAPEVSTSGLRLVVEQDGELIEAIDQYVTANPHKLTPEKMALSQHYFVPQAIRSINGANLLAYIVDLDWYASIWCEKTDD